MLCVVCFFFFQAEDGIRDYKVTGVQTCALPISSWSRRAAATSRALRSRSMADCSGRCVREENMQFATVLKPELAARYHAAGLWLNKSFFEVIEERARAHPDREVFADAGRRITYGELEREIERCAEFLRSIGIGRGDVVTVQLPNRIAFPVVFFSLELIGAVANKVNPDFRARELEYILKFSGSRAYVCPREFKGFDYVAMAKTLQAAVPALTHVIVAGGSAEGVFDLDAGIADSPPIAA